MRKVVKWFLITACVGFIPIGVRCFVSLFFSNVTDFQIFTIPDIIVWSLVLNIAIFNERKGLFSFDPYLSYILTVITVVLIFIGGIIFCLGLTCEINDLFSKDKLFIASVCISFSTLFFGVVFVFICYPLYLLGRGKISSSEGTGNG